MLRRRMMLLAAGLRYVFLKITGGFELDADADLRASTTDPLSTASDITFGTALEMEAKPSAVLPSGGPSDLGWDGELYVQPNAAMKTNEPVSFGSELEPRVVRTGPGAIKESVTLMPDVEGHATASAAAEVLEIVPIVPVVEGNAVVSAPVAAREETEIIPEIQGNAAASVPCGVIRGFEIDCGAEGNAIASTPIGVTGKSAEFSGEFELKTLSVAPMDRELESFELGGVLELELPDSAVLLTDFGVAFGMEAELWVRNSVWLDPVFKNGVLGITQVNSVVQKGRTIKIY